MPEYNHKKNYSWNEHEAVTITGMQFASFYHLLSREMNNPGGADLAIKVEAFNVMMSILKDGVRKGWVVEDTPEQLPANVSAGTDPAVKNLFK